MKISETEIKDLYIFEPTIFGDSRGYFFETWKDDIFKNLNINFIPVQQNESGSVYGVIRGLHYQLNPYAQAKLVRVIVGEVLDVAVDLRKNSPTFGKYFSVVLSGENKKQFFIPRGFAHGFSVLSDFAIFSYLCDNYYFPEAERGIAFNDPFLGIDWKVPENKMIVSKKDLNNKSFSLSEINF